MHLFLRRPPAPDVRPEKGAGLGYPDRVTAEPFAGQDAPAGGLDALSVVIPVYNEETWVRRSVKALLEAADAAGLSLDVVVVDDGSTDNTPAVLDELAARAGIVVHTQPNAGRLAARAAGLALAREPWVLLLDSRVIIDRDALRWLKQQLADHPDRQVWCGHVDVDIDQNPYAAFWSGLVKIGWRRYTAKPRLVSFGTEEFDYYPKGTGCLVIRQGLLREAVGSFDSMFDNDQLSSDDTRLLRYVASKQRIWLSPDFAFRYHGKTGARGFVRQSYFRGTTFIDGYLGQPGVVRRALIAGLAVVAVFGVLTVRRPVIGAAGYAAGIVAIPSVVRLSGGSGYEVRSSAALAPAFIPVFGAGLLRGLTLAAVRALRPRARTR